MNKKILAILLIMLPFVSNAEEPTMMQPVGDLTYCENQTALSEPFNANECSILKFGWPVQVLETNASIAKVSIVRNIMTYDTVEAFVRIENLAPEGSQAPKDIMVNNFAFVCPTAEAAIAYWKHSRTGEVVQAINSATDANCKKVLPEIPISVYGQEDPEVYEVSAFVQQGPVKTPIKGFVPRGAIR